jgi:hypothetical protein
MSGQPLLECRKHIPVGAGWDTDWSRKHLLRNTAVEEDREDEDGLPRKIELFCAAMTPEADHDGNRLYQQISALPQRYLILHSV